MTTPTYELNLGPATILAGRQIMDTHLDALHVFTAQVIIPRFATSPVVIATVSQRSGSADVIVGAVNNPGQMLVVWEINYNPDATDTTYLTFNAANVSEGLALNPDYRLTIDYIVIGTVSDCIAS